MTVPVNTRSDVLAAVDHLRAALSGAGPAVRPALAPAPPLALGPADDDPRDPTTVAVSSSGSTGEPKTVLLPASALLASAAATHDRLGGPGHWLLPLPAQHVAGVQVLIRSLVARSTPVVLDPQASFTAEAFAAGTAQLPAGRRYTSLVPTQLGRLLDDTGGRAALRTFDAVLLGGAAAPAPLLERAAAAGVHVVTTYGMSETSGGCVYDGRALDGVRVRLDDDGRVRLSGPTLARGYLGAPAATAAAFVDSLTGREFVTSDQGRWLDDGRLAVVGRLDDVLITGGVNVAPAAVEAVAHRVPGVAEVVVVGVPDATWGQRVVAAVVVEGSIEPDGLLADLRRAVTAELGAPAAPRELVLLNGLPVRGPGKPDRAAVLRIVTERLEKS
ncbi:o-succinylbenzoate--CoA ligase [Spongisporangium articulatum]|uniref:O-succinylbenzoate--CoA ligase n=1 Tax=Spongisporangium articulatum TaxID=3362603 RepID=A0ABW8ANP5_9ACTN